MTPTQHAALVAAADLQRRVMYDLWASKLRTSAIAELLLSHDDLIVALRNAHDAADGRELLIRAMVHQHGGRFRVTLGSLQAVTSTTPLRTLADLTFKHQVLELGVQEAPGTLVQRLVASWPVQVALGFVWRWYGAGRLAREAWALGRIVARGRAAGGGVG